MGIRILKTIGLIGGMSWESTVPYYRIINQTVRERLGGLHSARIVLYSVDFHEVDQLQRKGDWDAAGTLMAEAAAMLERAGADLIVLCSNTMHKVAPAIEDAISIPFLHIVDVIAREVTQAGFTRVGLLGTRFTMEEPFALDRFRRLHDLEVLTPVPEDREIVHGIIYDELCQGKVTGESREAYRSIMSVLVDRGAQAIILGCTEISLLVGQEDTRVPLFDTTRSHARCAALAALD